jgi:pimeloyl-ACP methyl ester carboxylesterase
MQASNASAKTAPGNFATVNGLKMYYELHGKGFPLVLIHGGGSTIHTTFGSILPALANQYRVVAVEMQAHGHTQDIDRPLSFSQDADDVAALLGKLGVAKAHVFGFSNGASTALEMAIRHPQLVAKVIVASTMYKRDGAHPWFWEMMANASFEEMPGPYKEAFLEINPDPKALHRMYERDVKRMQTFIDIPEAQIREIAAPALIICGDKDVVRAAHAAEMAEQMKDARLMILPSGHGEYIGELLSGTVKLQDLPALTVILSFLSE